MKKILKLIIALLLILVVSFLFLHRKGIPVSELIPKYTNEYSKFVDIDGMNVHYRTEGSGSPVFLIHGTGSCLQTWDVWTDSLKKYHTIIRMDLPGFGLTGARPDNNYSIDMYAKFIDDFATTLNIDTFAIGGNSLGGQIAWYYAATYPEKISKLILVDPAGFYDLKKGGSLVFNMARKKWLAKWLGKLDTKFSVNNTLREVYYDKSKISDKFKNMYYDMSMREGNREAFMTRVQSIEKDQTKDLSKLNMPTLILWGKEDLLIPINMLDSFTVIPNAQKIVYEKVGHSPQEEIPTESVIDAIRFLQ